MPVSEPSPDTTARRSWAGTTLADRRARRRRQLLDAGLQLMGTGDTATVSVRAVCRTARLTERYFYESFSGRDDLALGVYEEVAEQARTALVEAVAASTAGHTAPVPPAVLARAAVTAFVELILDDPRKGTVLLLAPMTDPDLNRRGSELLPAFTEVIHDQLPDRLDDEERELTAVGLVGALTNLFVRYLNGTLAVPRDRLIEHCVRLVAAAADPPR